MDYLRSSGRSTRLVDNTIQDLFIAGICIIRDHHRSVESSRYLMERVLQRLENEHGILKNGDVIAVNYIKFTIKLNKI